jgi:hypothetical protein
MERELSQALEATGEKRLPNIEKYYLTVVVRKLTTILKKSTLSSHHLAASQVIIRIARMVGPQMLPLVQDIVNSLTFCLKHIEMGNNLRDGMLDHLMTMVLVVGRGMRFFLPEMKHLIVHFFSYHPRACMDLVEALSLKLARPGFNSLFTGIVPVILQTLRDEPFEVVRAATGGEGAGNSAAARQQQTVSLASTLFGMIGEGGLGQDLALPKVSKILQMFINISEILGNHKQYIIPALLRILDMTARAFFTARKQVLVCVMHLSDDDNLHDYANQVS